MGDLSEEPSNSERQNEFSSLMDRVMGIEWKKAILAGLRSYNLKLYNISGLSPKKVRDLYLHLLNKQSAENQEQSHITQQHEVWRQNELRVFLWVLLAYGQLLKKPLQRFVNAYSNIGRRVVGVPFQTLPGEGTFRNIKRTSSINSKWALSEDKLLTEILSEDVEQNRWNEVAKQLFYRSERRFFRSAKHCRERWNNYLDPTKYRGQWSLHEDFILVNFAVKEGKKWAAIARALGGRRTEHMVKNRYKSLLSKQMRLMSLSDDSQEEIAMEALLTRLSGSVPAESSNLVQLVKPQTLVKIETKLILPTSPEKQSLKDQHQRNERLEILFHSPFFGATGDSESEPIVCSNLHGREQFAEDDFIARMHCFTMDSHYD